MTIKMSIMQAHKFYDKGIQTRMYERNIILQIKYIFSMLAYNLYENKHQKIKRKNIKTNAIQKIFMFQNCLLPIREYPRHLHQRATTAWQLTTFVRVGNIVCNCLVKIPVCIHKYIHTCIYGIVNLNIYAASTKLKLAELNLISCGNCNAWCICICGSRLDNGKYYF